MLIQHYYSYVHTLRSIFLVVLVVMMAVVLVVVAVAARLWLSSCTDVGGTGTCVGGSVGCPGGHTCDRDGSGAAVVLSIVS